MSNHIILKENCAPQINVTNYPDGQRTVQLHLESLDKKKPIRIDCRIKNFSELEVLGSLLIALYKNDFYIEKLNFIYLYGMRSDRAFQLGEPNYFRDVLAPIIRQWTAGIVRNIKIFLPHNQFVLEYANAQLYDFPAISFGFAYDRNYHESIDGSFHNYYLFGDESASFLKKNVIFDIYMESNTVGEFSKKRIDNNIEIFLNDKTRERISSIKSNHPIIIMDDLCDAGGTFIAEALYLRNIGVTNPLRLFVGHALFTKGLEPLLEHFEHIYTTNSYQDILHPQVTQLKVI